MIVVALSLDQSGPYPWVEHHKFDLQIIGNVGFPRVGSWVMLFDFGSIVQFFPNVE